MVDAPLDGRHFLACTRSLVKCILVLACVALAFHAATKLNRFFHVQLINTAKPRQVHPADELFSMSRPLRDRVEGLRRPSFSL